MIPRFRTKTEIEYTNTFPKDGWVTDYYDVCDKKKYEALLKRAMKRGTPVTENEIIDLAGIENYMEQKKYIQSYMENP